MKKSSKILLLLGIGIAFGADLASAETVCLRSRIKNGRVVNTSKVVADNAACPKGFKALFSSTTLTTSGLVGPQGPQGPQGIQGIQGVQGAAGTTFTLQYVVNSSIEDSNTPKSITATCPANTEVIGGYESADDGGLIPIPGVALTYQGFALTGEGFTATAYETTAVPGTWVVRALAVCKTL